MRQGENGLQDKFENIIKRVVLNSTHLLTILHNIEAKFGTIQRSVRGGMNCTRTSIILKARLKGY